MKKLTRNLRIFVLLCAAAIAQSGGLKGAGSTPSSTGAQTSVNASTQAHDSSFVVPEGSVFHVVLAKNIDAKKNKIGDEVMTTTVEDLKSNGQVVIPKNSKVIGHITQIQSRSKDNARSQIAIVFDRLMIKDGSEISVSALIQAVAAPQTAPAGENEQSSTGYGEVGGSTGGGMAGSGGRGSSPSGYPPGAGGRGPSGGIAGTPAGAENSAGGAAGQVRDANSARLTATSQGVLGLKGLSLSTQDDGSSGSVISSDHRNVHLEHGTQFVLRVKAK